MQSVSTAPQRGICDRASGDIVSAIEAEAGQARRVDEAILGLRARSPELSAATGLWAWQKRALAVGLLGLCAGSALAPETTLIALLAIMAFPFLCVVMLRSVALLQLRHPIRAAAPPVARGAAPLPLYTVLVPLFREAGVVAELLASLRALDYPTGRLEIMLIVERADAETQLALHRANLDAHMRVLVVPDGEPRTKPRAIQYALQWAHGDYVVVYDAEDAPEPDQLRRALAAIAPGAAGSAACRRSSTSITRMQPGSPASSPSSTPLCSTASCRRSSGCNCRCRSVARPTISPELRSNGRKPSAETH